MILTKPWELNVAIHSLIDLLVPQETRKRELEAKIQETIDSMNLTETKIKVRLYTKDGENEL